MQQGKCMSSVVPAWGQIVVICQGPVSLGGESQAGPLVFRTVPFLGN